MGVLRGFGGFGVWGFEGFGGFGVLGLGVWGLGFGVWESNVNVALITPPPPPNLVLVPGVWTGQKKERVSIMRILGSGVCGLGV